MAISFTLNLSGTGYSPIGVTTSGNVSESVSVVIPASTANVPLASLIFNTDQLQSVFMYADGGNLTVKTNDATTPDDTFTFVANVPMSWATGMPIDNPFTANVTGGLFVTNAGASNVTLSGTLNYN